jgi:hypothetical protein
MLVARSSDLRHAMTTRRLVPAVLATAAILPATALGSTANSGTVAPTSAQRAAIVNAFGDPGAAVPCLTVLLAASNHDYATVRFRSRKAGCLRWGFDGRNVFKRGARRHWSLVFAGSAYRCPVARVPGRVQRQLGVCP